MPDPTQRAIEALEQKLKQARDYAFGWLDTLQGHEKEKAACGRYIADLLNQIDALRSLPSSTGVPSYSMSRDYEALYELLCAGGDAFCLVNMTFSDGDVYRDVARARRRGEWQISVGARGIEYGDVRDYHREKYADERSAFLAACARMNLEWLSPSKEPETHIGKLVEVGPEHRDMIARIRNYFGQHHDRTPFEHAAFTFMDRMLDRSSAPKEPASSPEGAKEQ